MSGEGTGRGASERVFPRKAWERGRLPNLRIHQNTSRSEGSLPCPEAFYYNGLLAKVAAYVFGLETATGGSSSKGDVGYVRKRKPFGISQTPPIPRIGAVALGGNAKSP